MADRRESRISKIPVPNVPLQERTSNVALKRKATDQVQEATQPKRLAQQPVPMSTRGSKPAVTEKPVPAPVVEENFEDIQARTGLSVDDVLSKKLNFKKTTQPAQKVEELLPFVKQLRALGWHLHTLKEKAVLDAEQWQRHAESLTQQLKEQTDAWEVEKADLEQQIAMAKATIAESEAAQAHLKREIMDLQRLAAQRGEDIARLQALEGELRAEAMRRDTQLAEREGKVKELDDIVQQAHKYSSTLQTYNTSLQSDVTAEKAKNGELQRAHDVLAGQVAHMGGMNKSLEQLLQFEKDQLAKLRGEAEVNSRDMAVLRGDLDSARQERDRALAQAARLKEEVDRFKAVGGRSVEMLEEMSHSKASLEVQLSTQAKLMEAMRAELAELKQQRALDEGLSSSRVVQIGELQGQVDQLQKALADAEQRVHHSEIIRRKLHNLVQELKGNIRVYCRVRPVSAAELAQEGDSAMVAVDFPLGGDTLGKNVAVTVPSSSAGQPPVRHSFAFDNVFGPSSTQEDVFLEISELVQSALDGKKVCIFAYGQTGSGKTFTMLGSAEEPGIIPRAMTQVFETSRRLADQGWSFTMAASMLEIYNEDIKDLLAKRSKNAEPKKHNIVHDAAGNTMVAELTLADVNDSARVEALLADAMEKRSVGCTALNEQSSRSHMVFTLRIDGVNSATEQRVQGVLNLIDLAGSERVKDSGAVGIRLKEAQNINKSLSALGDVIAALSQKTEHIPFRNSKLTYLLQPCLGGDAKTLMFVNCAPSRDFSHETLASLRFASKVNACEINATRKGAK